MSRYITAGGTVLAANLRPGDRILTEHGNATVELVYPESLASRTSRHDMNVIVQPDGYAATRTVEFGLGGHAVLVSA